MENSEVAERVVSLMNELLQLDQEAIQGMIDTRVNCNPDLADHPFVQVTPDNQVGILGVLNGLTMGDGFIVVHTDEGGRATGFSHIKELP